MSSFASSYVKTVTAAVTRNADVLTYPSAGNISGTVGSVYAEIFSLGVSQSTGFIGVDNGSRLLHRVSPTIAQFYDGTTSTQKEGLLSIETGIRKQASSYGGSSKSITADGQAPAVGAFDGSISTSAIRVANNNAGGGGVVYGTIKQVRIWTRALSDSELIGITK